MADESIGPLEFFIKPGKATFGEILDLLFALNDLYVLMGGDRLRFYSTDFVEKEVPESSYELNIDSSFKNTNKTLEESIFPRYVPRKQVYDAIDRFAIPDMVEPIKQILDRKFPREKFNDSFPYCSIFNILYNDYLSENRRRK